MCNTYDNLMLLLNLTVENQPSCNYSQRGPPTEMCTSQKSFFDIFQDSKLVNAYNIRHYDKQNMFIKKK